MVQVVKRLPLGYWIQIPADQISYRLPTTRHRYKLDVWTLDSPGAKLRRWTPLTRDILMGINRV